MKMYSDYLADIAHASRRDRQRRAQAYILASAGFILFAFFLGVLTTTQNFGGTVHPTMVICSLLALLQGSCGIYLVWRYRNPSPELFAAEVELYQAEQAARHQEADHD